MRTAAAALCLASIAAQASFAWGLRGHTIANLAALAGIPEDGPVFLRAHKAYIGHLGTIPDTWRSPAEPYLRISEDANHSWYTEGFAFIPVPPRSRTEFILRVHDEYLRQSRSDPSRAKLLNIRYTGLQAYSIIEGYERIKAGMRLYRLASGEKQFNYPNMAGLYAGVSPLYRDPEQVRQMLATDIAFYIGWAGHYVADAAQPLHDSIHHDGWSGENPKGYTRDPEIHGRFETDFVNLIGTTESDVVKYMNKRPRHLEDPWAATLEHSLNARNYVEDVYRLDLKDAFRTKDSAEARELVYKRLAAGASFLCDLIYTAWIESAKPTPLVKPGHEIQNPANPEFNPAAGSAPAPN